MSDISVVIVDDDALVRTGLRLLLGADPGITVVGEADNGAAVADLVARTRPDVVLMDVRMPGMDGITATRHLLESDPDARVLVLTTFDTDQQVVEALRAGALGFVLKDTPPQRLVAAVRDVAQGEHVLSPAVTALLVRHVVDAGVEEASGHLDLLTARELEVADAVGRGWSNAEIARELHMGLPTVKAHVSRIMAKVGVVNRVQLALVVRRARA